MMYLKGSGRIDRSFTILFMITCETINNIERVMMHSIKKEVMLLYKFSVFIEVFS